MCLLKRIDSLSVPKISNYCNNILFLFLKHLKCASTLVLLSTEDDLIGGSRRTNGITERLVRSCVRETCVFFTPTGLG
jgi:hypothetical protein